MQPAFLQHNSGGVVDVLHHGFRQERLFAWVLRHHINEGLGLTSECFRVGYCSVSGFGKALFHVAHFAADLVPLFLVDLRQVGVEVTGEGDEGRRLQAQSVRDSSRGAAFRLPDTGKVGESSRRLCRSSTSQVGKSVEFSRKSNKPDRNSLKSDGLARKSRKSETSIAPMNISAGRPSRFFVKEEGSDADQLVVLGRSDDDRVTLLGPFPTAAGFPPGLQVFKCQKGGLADALFEEVVPGALDFG